MKQAQAQARAQAKDGNKKENSAKKSGGAILHVNNYRNGVPEAKCKMSKNPNFPSSLKPGYIVRSKGSPAGPENSFVVEAKLAARVYMVRNQRTDKFCSLKIEPYYNEGDVKQLKRDVFILLEAMKLDRSIL
uniref:Uncharacterized protein n=1 Tax=Panagrolaimus superbus TaxID=310955 RepID=A0A914YTR9_9BILA